MKEVIQAILGFIAVGLIVFLAALFRYDVIGDGVDNDFRL